MSGQRQSAPRITALGVVARPSAPSRTSTLVEAVLAAATAEGAADARVIVLGERVMAFADGTPAENQSGDTRVVLEAVDAADALVFGTPVYRATMAGEMKNLLDLLPRGSFDGAAQALRAKPVAIAATGATAHHFLALDSIAAILRGFFAAYVVPPGVYACHADFDADGRLASESVSEAAWSTGKALVALERAIRASPALRAVEPQV